MANQFQPIIKVWTGTCSPEPYTGPKQRPACCVLRNNNNSEPYTGPKQRPACCVLRNNNNSDLISEKKERRTAACFNCVTCGVDVVLHLKEPPALNYG
ncbi:hypothetical protein QE152_g34479 [Popillia japonica]|uniref:Uncharacterized protein n=1 Tax=Popillia japonica TaxID=7064 RepID=A0AAW1ITB6_POPJA